MAGFTPDYGHWGNTHRRFIRWRDKGIWEKLLEVYEWLMTDVSHFRAHSGAAGVQGGNQAMSRPKGAQHPTGLAVDAHGLPVRTTITQGAALACKQALPLAETISAQYLPADRAYDTHQILSHCEE